MKICMVTWEFPPRIVGGISRHCYGLSKALAKRGHEVYLITLDFPGTPLEEEIEGVKVYRTKVELGHPDFLVWTFLFNHFMEKRIAMICKSIKFDVIHVHDWLTAPAGIATKHFLNKPLVSTIHSTEIGRAQGLHSPDSYLIDGVEWWLTYESKRIIVASHAMKNEIQNHFHLPPEKIDVIPNAVEIERYSKNVDRNKVRLKCGVKPYEKLVLFVGRLVPQKGVEHLIRAIPEVTKEHPNVKFVIAGEGWSKGYLESSVKSLKCQDRVRFLGFIPDDELVELTISADLLVVPSSYEPFGIVALEGMAAGIPVVASNTGGLSEVIEHDRTGVLVYPRDPHSIAWGIKRVLSDPEYSSRIIQNAKRKVIEIYSWEAVAEKTLQVYKMV
ncbi:TPA: glycosyltransferase family 1 protein [Candidatus Bathyarchaeota archaeon]|nr:glycosyltransferase family 1 protein [Candidatus Bathyarchaeota archaeon]